MRRRFLITNETRFRTADLRKMLRAAAPLVFDPDEKPKMRVRVVYARRANVTGCASIGGTSMLLRIGKEFRDIREVGALIVHEMGHLKGLTHQQMRGGSRWTWKGVPGGMDAQTGRTWSGWEEHLRQHEWAKAFTLHEEKPTHRPRLAGVALVERRREQTIQSLEHWTRKAKRAENAVRKLRARLRYYDRRAAALTTGGSEG